ncbi:MAG TPA: cobaltochelatase subunit CobN [Chloroflexia bacterium]|nr:cobaltochelatase subunit CobN [Chloroflexia bacterium]
MKFLFLLLDNIYLDALDQAAASLRRELKLPLEIKNYLCKDLKEGSDRWQDFERDLAECDFFFANMIVQNEQALPLQALLVKHGPLKPERALVILNSMPQLMRLNRLGNFEFEKMLQFVKSNPVTKVTGFMTRLVKHNPEQKIEERDAEEVQDQLAQNRNERKRLRNARPVKKGMHSGMVAMMRTLPAVLKLIPGHAQDLRAYILFMTYWLNGTPDNLENMLLFAIEKYVPGFDFKKLKRKVKEPVMYPRLALFHPDAPGRTFESREEFDKWRSKAKPGSEKRPKIGLITMRAFYLTGNYHHIDRLVAELEKAGVEAVPSYAAGLDFRPCIETFYLEEARDKHSKNAELKPLPSVDLVMNLSGFSLVGGGAENDAEAAIAQLQRLNVPAWAVIPLFFQSETEWRASRTGLNPVQAALQVAVPELDGATEPRVYAAGAERGPDKALYAMPEETVRLARRAARFARLHHLPNSQKKVAITLFNFPPNKGNVGTAAYLAVFESVYRLLVRLKAEGYQVDLPADTEEFRRMVVEGNSSAYGTSANLHTHVSVADYQRLTPFWQDIEQLWGPPPGNLLSDREGLQILGRQFGNVLIGLQPSFGYEDDPMRLLMATNASPHHGFAAYYTYLDKIWQADTVLHFGTHGSLEFMPGKQIGLSAKCWPDRLIGDLPNYYFYSVNNPSEGTIAKRRGFATLLSYLSPPMESAGLYQNLLQLKDIINVYRKALAEGYSFSKKNGERNLEALIEYKPQLAVMAADSGGSAGDFEEPQGPLNMLLGSIIEQARALELRPKVKPEEDPDGYVLSLYTELLEVEERLIPSGLHIADEPPAAEMLTDVLYSISSYSRGKAGSDEEARSLTELIAEALGYDLEAVRRQATRDNDNMARWERISSIQKRAVGLFVAGLRAGQIEKGKREAAECLFSEGRVPLVKTYAMWDYLAEVAEALLHNTEIEQVIRAFRGEYIEPSGGNDIVRNPAVLPTGRNIHGLDPALVPTPVARKAGEKSARAMLERAQAELGMGSTAYPETIAMVLWGTDNIKSDGEGVAQALYLMGARPVVDGLGKVSNVKLIPLHELGRPRIDVVVTVSGIFRDLMPNQMELLDRAARLAAQADESLEDNYIKKHVTEELAKGTPFDEAVARVFSNAPGSYGANVNFMVDSGAWETEADLAEAFLTRKGFAYGLKVEGAEARKLMENALKRVELSFQNVDSAEIGITDVDHYYEYLGGITKTVERLNGGKRPPALMADSQSATGGGLSQGNAIKSLEEMVRLEARSKLLNPRWYEGMLKYGYEGVREIETRVSNTFGWSATASAVEGWVYNGIDNTFVKDEAMRERLAQLNPYSLKGIVGRLLEANGRGYWEADASTIERLKEIYAGLEDEIEGLGEATNAQVQQARSVGRNL